MEVYSIMKNNVKYMCRLCKCGHDSFKQVRMCQIAAKDDPTNDEILEYVTLKEELQFKEILSEVEENKAS